MKLICDTIFTLKDSSKCIAHYSVDECARHVLQTQEDAFVYYITPGEESDAKFKFARDLAADFPGRVKYFEGHHFPNNRVYQFLWRPEWFADLIAGTGYAWDWDVLLTMRGPVMQHVRWLNWGSSQKAKRIVIQDHFPILDFKVGAKFYFSGKKDMQLTTLTSYVMADKVVVGADYEVRGIMKAAREHLSAAICKRLQNKLTTGFVIPRGLDLEYPLKKAPKKSGEKVVGIFTQRIGLAGRHPFEVLDTFFYSFVMRPKGAVEFQISTNSMIEFTDSALKKYTFIKFYRSSREEFYQRLRESDFCISFSTTEGMPTSILEAICWGCIPILIRYDWSVDMVGEHYPFLFRNVAQAVAMVNSILDDPTSAFERYQEWYRDYFLRYLERCGTLPRSVDEAIASNREAVAEFTERRKGNEIYSVLEAYVKRIGLKRFTLFDLLEKAHADKVVRIDPNMMGVGQEPQSSMGNAIPARLPNYYTVLHTLLRKTGWKRGLEVGEIVVP